MNSLKGKLILGTVQLGLPYGINNTAGKPDLESAFQILSEARLAGITRLDTAEGYGESQEIIGRFHDLHKNEFSVITKFAPSRFAEQSNFRKHVEASLKTLNVPYLEAYMYHSYGDFKRFIGYMAALRSMQREGLIRKIGVSLYTNQEIEDLLLQGQPVDLVQCPFNLLDNSTLRGAAFEALRKRGIEIHVRSIFLQGLFMMNSSNLSQQLSGLAPHLMRIKQLALDFEIPVEALAINYALQNEKIDGVLFGVETLQQLKANLDFASGYQLGTEAVRAIDEIKVETIELLNPANWTKK